jgi:hypothetical protein
MVLMLLLAELMYGGRVVARFGEVEQFRIANGVVCVWHDAINFNIANVKISKCNVPKCLLAI